MVSVSPAWSEKSTPLTAATSVLRRVNRTVRSSTRRTGERTLPSGMVHRHRRLGGGNMAGYDMRRVGIAIEWRRQLGQGFRAPGFGKTAAGAKPAARGWIDRVGRIA